MSMFSIGPVYHLEQRGREYFGLISNFAVLRPSVCLQLPCCYSSTSISRCETQKEQKSHMEININHRYETEPQVHTPTWGEASGRGEAIIPNEWMKIVLLLSRNGEIADSPAGESGVGADCLQFLWREFHFDLVLRAGPGRPASPCWKDVSLLLQSVLQDADRKKQPAKTPTELSFKVRFKKTKGNNHRDVHLLVSFHWLFVT